MQLKPQKINKSKKDPKVSYEFIESETGENGLDTAFDILFEEVIKTQKSIKELSTL